MSAFRVKLGANDLNCVDVPLNPTHSLTVNKLGGQNPISGYFLDATSVFCSNGKKFTKIAYNTDVHSLCVPKFVRGGTYSRGLTENRCQ